MGPLTQVDPQVDERQVRVKVTEKMWGFRRPHGRGQLSLGVARSMATRPWRAPRHLVSLIESLDQDPERAGRRDPGAASNRRRQIAAGNCPAASGEAEFVAAGARAEMCVWHVLFRMRAGSMEMAGCRMRKTGFEFPEVAPRAGQIVLSPAAPDVVRPSQIRKLYRLSDPALSEMGLEEFLDEL